MYQVWHKAEKILEISGETVTVFNSMKLPFDLRHYSPISFNRFNQWLSKRLNTLSRTYMNKLYMQRRVGRSHADIINDSAALSPVDLFWVTRRDLPHTWESLQVLRDEVRATTLVSLTGEIDKAAIKNPKKDHTSIFSVKGAFQKGIYKGYLLKYGDNATHEVVATLLGNHLGISVAQAKILDESWLPENTVGCELFTNAARSLVHASELLYDFDATTYEDRHVKALDYAKDNPALLSGLRRLFILNYLASNMDLHEENFGFMYDTETFEILEVAPAYDFNSAFASWDDVSVYYEDILERLTDFINNEISLIPKLKCINDFLKTCPFLSEADKNEIHNRADYLLSLVTPL